MPAAGQRQSRQRREKVAAEAAAKATNESGDARSLLAEFIRDPTSHRERALVKAAANGRLTTHDIQAAITQQVALVRGLLPGRGRKTEKSKAEALQRIETERPVHVLLKQLMDGLREVVQSAPNNGALVVVELHWPEAYAHTDHGDHVIKKPPEGFT